MLNVIASCICFAFFLGLGMVCMFVKSSAWFLILPFLLYLVVLKLSYKSGTCITLEWKDFIHVLVISFLEYLLYQYLDVQADFGTFSYLYLTSFVSCMLYINTQRYKSMI